MFLLILAVGFGVIALMISGLYSKLDLVSRQLNALRTELRQPPQDAVTDA
jgi:hypothetical protein